MAGIPCLAIRLGFVGEVGWELHHAASRSEELWAALLEAGEAHGVQPFGIQAQRLLRLEKGHIIVSQDTDFETTPWRVDMGWAVKLEKDWFVGKRALVRKQETSTEKLIAYRGEARLAQRALGGRGGQGRRQARRPRDELLVLVVARPLRSASPGCGPSSPTRASAC